MLSPDKVLTFVGSYKKVVSFIIWSNWSGTVLALKLGLGTNDCKSGFQNSLAVVLLVKISLGVIPIIGAGSSKSVII